MIFLTDKVSLGLLVLAVLLTGYTLSRELFGAKEKAVEAD